MPRCSGLLPILRAQLLELRPPFFFFENSLLQRPWPFRSLPATLFPLRDPRRLRFRPATLEQRQQPEPGLLPVHRLGAGILIAHAQTARPVPQGDRAGDFVHMLSAGSGRPRKLLLELALRQSERA